MMCRKYDININKGLLIYCCFYVKDILTALDLSEALV